MEFVSKNKVIIVLWIPKITEFGTWLVKWSPNLVKLKIIYIKLKVEFIIYKSNNL